MQLPFYKGSKNIFHLSQADQSLYHWKIRLKLHFHFEQEQFKAANTQISEALRLTVQMSGRRGM